MLVEPQTIYDDNDQPAFVVLPYSAYQKMEALYDAALSDEEFFDQAMEENEEAFPAVVVDALLAGDNPIKVYRKHRGLKQKELAAMVDIQAVYLSQIETGRRGGSLELRRRIASGLGVDLDDLE
jgi:DNA-binding XRE family transcriptional regulator